jgi:Obg family GTPase CgtA-like protein
VSAVTYVGLEELKKAMFNALRSINEGILSATNLPAENVPVIRPEVHKSTELVVREPNGVFRIVHQKAVLLAKGSNLELQEARIQFQRRLGQLKVTKALRNAGIKTGDPVAIGDWEFDWE